MTLRALLLLEIPENLQDATDDFNILVELNVRYLRRCLRAGIPVYSLQEAADRGLVRYGYDTEQGPGHSLYGVERRAKTELLKTIPACLADGVMDCEDAAAWQCAWDSVFYGCPSTLLIYTAGPHLQHVVHARPADWPTLDVFDHFIRFYVMIRGRRYRVIDTALALGM